MINTQVSQIIVALVFNATDLLTGLVSAFKNKDIKSSKLRDGLFKKVGFMFCYFLAWLVDTQGTLIGFNIGVSVLPIMVLYSCTTEIVSIAENINKINPDILPEKIIDMLDIKHDKN